MKILFIISTFLLTLAPVKVYSKGEIPPQLIGYTQQYYWGLKMAGNIGTLWRAEALLKDCGRDKLVETLVAKSGFPNRKRISAYLSEKGLHASKLNVDASITLLLGWKYEFVSGFQDALVLEKAEPNGAARICLIGKELAIEALSK
ncbi:hypothetical protein ACJJIC_06950 [Microbulbifer sp. ANSA002]|uniref:hypothetical protein n=1 Tax=unclassified Microbulbifer TaxID=2619833 RepID=UPI0040436291